MCENMHPMWAYDKTWGALPEYLTEFHSLMRNLEDLDGNFPDTKTMDNLRKEAMAIMSSGASTSVAARRIRRKYKLPVPFLSKYDILEVLNAESMRASARRRNGRSRAAWNDGMKLRGRAALVREVELLAIAAGFNAKLYMEGDSGRQFEIEEGTPPTSSPTTPDPTEAQDLNGRERETVEGLLALSSSRRPRGTRPTTITLKLTPPQPEDPEKDELEIQDKPVETKKKRKAPSTRRTTISLKPASIVKTALQVEATEVVEAPVETSRKRKPQGTRRTTSPATTEPVLEPTSQEAAVGATQPPKPKKGTKRSRDTSHTTPIPAVTRDENGGPVQMESFVQGYLSSIRRGDIPTIVPQSTPAAMANPVTQYSSQMPTVASLASFVTAVEVNDELAAKRVKVTTSPLDSGISPTTISPAASQQAATAQTEVLVVPAVEGTKLTREAEFEMAAEAGKNIDQPRQTRGKRPTL